MRLLPNLALRSSACLPHHSIPLVCTKPTQTVQSGFYGGLLVVVFTAWALNQQGRVPELGGDVRLAGNGCVDYGSRHYPMSFGDMIHGVVWHLANALADCVQFGE
ncbi:hypothetical protein DXT90_08020 [Agrobacterium tumefaciens]|nr:hypothetical protein [Agrobacterium tumefaciens]